VRILFSHSNYPAQFRRIAPALAEDGHDIRFLYKSIEWNAPNKGSVELSQYLVSRVSASSEGALHPYLGRFEDAVLEGQAAARAALNLKEQGYYPDVIISHAGFGSGLYLKDVFPQARRIGFFEWYYTSNEGGDVHYLHHLYGNDVPLDSAMRLRTWNAVSLLELEQSDELVTPTYFQRSQFPQAFKERFHVFHEGIDFNHLKSLRQKVVVRPSYLPEDPSVPVVTHVVRGFELYRGFPQAINTLALLQKHRSDVHVVIAGADIVCYGGPSTAPTGESWGVWARNSAGLDPSRTHWVGVLQTDDYHTLLAVSNAHLYLTIPFVLSWSLLEAMAAGVPLVCSKTPPVEEVLNSPDEALLAPFDDPSALAQALDECLTDQEASKRRVRKAQTRASDYDASHGLRAWQALLSQ